MNARFAGRAPDLSVLACLLVGGGFSFYQAGSPIFDCGRVAAGWEIYAWLALSGVQSLLFLSCGADERARRFYLGTQYAMVPLVAAALAPIALAYPRIFLCAVLLGAAYWLAIRGASLLAGKPMEVRLVPALAETAVFLLATAVIHTAFAFVVLNTAGARLDDKTFAAIGIVSAVIAGWIVRREWSSRDLSMEHVPPLALLVVALLRAKLPDNAYDSLFYKTTLPLTIADWRTALTGAMDHTLVGTNFLEYFNAQLRILDGRYDPALTASFAFLALWLVVPVAARNLFGAQTFGSATAFTRNACALMLVSLSEPLTAAGTAYHEPMLALLMAASLLRMSAGWMFMAAAVMGKITVVFVLPVLVLLKIFAARETLATNAAPSPAGSWRTQTQARTLLRATLFAPEVRPAVLGACLLLAGLVGVEQFHRNIERTGRLMGVSEMLVGVTDPAGSVLKLQSHDPLFDQVGKRGATEKYGQTLVHVLTLDRWIVPDDLGFHVMPTSRLIAIAVPLVLLVVLVPALRRDRALLALYLAWLVCAFALLNFFSQGRHIFPLSFAAALLVAWLAGSRVLEARQRSRGGFAALFCGAIAVVAIGDQVVGSFTNNAWECRRKIATPADPTNIDRPVSPIEQRLAAVVALHKAHRPQATAFVPSIICEPSVERMHYLGAHYVYAHATVNLNERYLQTRPERAAQLPSRLLAVCFTSEAFLERMIPDSQRHYFQEIPGAGTTRIVVSRELVGAGAAGAAGGNVEDALLAMAPPVADMVAHWELGQLNDLTPVSAPGGKGAFAMTVEGRKYGVLLSPFTLRFDNVEFARGGHVWVELAMPHSNSDGMAVRLSFEAGGRRESVTIDLAPKPVNAKEPTWTMRQVMIPEGFVGRGRLTVAALSPSGSSDADWAYVRRLQVGQ